MLFFTTFYLTDTFIMVQNILPTLQVALSGDRVGIT